MPTYDELLDVALLAESVGRRALREAVGRLREAFPEDPCGRALEATSALAEGDWEAVERLLRGFGRTPVERAFRAMFAEAQGDPEEARRRIEAALADDPNDPFVLRCGYAVLGLEQPARVLAFIGRWAELRPHDPLPSDALGVMHFGAHDLAGMKRLADEPPPPFAGTGRWELLRSRVALLERDLPRAEAHARAAVALMPDHESTWSGLAMILNAQGRKPEAAEAARYALQIDRRESTAMRIVAIVLDAEGKPTEAEEWRRRARAAAPSTEFIEPLHRANALRSEGHVEAALAALAPLAKGTPLARRLGHSQRVKLLIALKDDDALAHEVASLEAVAPQHEALVLGKAEVARRAHRLREARELLEAAWAVRRMPDAAAPLIDLLTEIGDSEACAALCEDLIAEVPPYPPAAGMACLAVERAGRYEAAVRFLAEARRRFPGEQSLQVLNVAALRRAGDHARANEAFRRLEPDRRERLHRRAAALPEPWTVVRELGRTLFERMRKKR